MPDTATEAEPQAPPAHTTPDVQMSPTSAPAVAHTPGGLPAVPAAVSAGNTLVGLVSAAALTGGPLAATAAAVGTAALTGAGAGALAARRARRTRASISLSGGRLRPSLRGSRSGTRGALGGRSPRGRGSGLGLGGSRGGTSRRGAGALSRGGGRKSAGAGLPKQRFRTSAFPSAAGRTSLTKQGHGASASKRSNGLLSAGRSGRKGGGWQQGGARSGSRSGRGALGAVRSIRQARAAAAPTRQAARKQAATDRRALADARRAAKVQRRQAKAAAKGKPNPSTTHPRRGGEAKAGRLATLRERARRRMAAAREKHRTRRDARGDDKVRRLRRLRRLADARGRMHRRILTSHMRYWGRRTLSAIAALPVGALGMLSTPLGRKLHARSLMFPGRKLHAHLARAAKRARLHRNARIRGDHQDEVAALDADEPEPVADTVPRAPRHHNAAPTAGGPMSSTTPGFNFEEHAAAMEEAALKYEPEGMMQVLKTCENMPQALTHIADTFKHLAERSDEEFPLEKEVGESLSEVYTLLMKAAEAAEEVGTTFRKVHEQDIARHEEPRVNEQTWDTTNNE